ncbi:MAG: hypothetical protein LBP63_10840 [Prevotellaceae bacterium]|jgi:hypothetical protein|nr:hypothetical protein [Prevotellaceae bacterium]
MEKINLTDRTTVEGTGKIKTYPKNVKFQVHPKLANKLIEAGKAIAVKK